MIHTLIHQFGVFVWKKKSLGKVGVRGGATRDKRRGRMKKEKIQKEGKEIKGRDCEPRRETYGLFLVSSCVSHPENSAEEAHL